MLAVSEMTFTTEDGPELDLQRLELVVAHLTAVAAVNEQLGRQAAALRAKAQQALALPVSYTHLTLPTILRV